MDEYIKREALLKSKDWLALQEFDKARAKVIILGQPAADVVEVRHGEWKCTTRAPKRVDGYYHWGAPLETIFVCSECGRAEKNKEPYCNCGAKMDGKGEGE